MNFSLHDNNTPYISGQQYDTKTWKMNLLPNIPASVMMRLDLKHYYGLHHGNKLYLSYTWPNTRSQKHNPVCSQNNLISSADQPRPLLVYDIFLKQWSSETLSNTRLFCLDRPVWMWCSIKPFKENSAEQILLQFFPGIPFIFPRYLGPKFCVTFISSDRGSYSDDVVVKIHHATFSVFTQPIDEIDVTRVKCRLSDVGCGMSNVKCQITNNKCQISLR